MEDTRTSDVVRLSYEIPMGMWKSMIFTGERKMIWETINWEKLKETRRLSNNTLECLILESRKNGERETREDKQHKKKERKNQ